MKDSKHVKEAALRFDGFEPGAGLRSLVGGVLTTVFSLSLAAVPNEGRAAHQSLDELLNDVKQERRIEDAENKKRERRFLRSRNEQSALLAQAKGELAREQSRGERLKQEYDANEVKIESGLEALKETQGAIGELHGIVRQISGDVAGMMESSLVSAQFPKRTEFLRHLSDSKELPTFDDLEKLWHMMLEQMVESGKVVRFPAETINGSGEEEQQIVTRIGTFSAIAGGQFLRYLPETGRLLVPPRQPPLRYQELAREFENATEEVHAVPIDPTRGSMLALLVQKPNLIERIRQGGVIGYIIIVLGIIGLVIALSRLVVLSALGRRMREQLMQNKPDEGNPLGRVMKVFFDAPQADTETLGLKLDEAILRELPAIQRGLSTLAILGAVAPLLGLLGTVTGIIETFQSITLFGTGDPRLMSGGISQALVTTVLGLVVAIPILLLHSFLSGNSGSLIQILDEQSAALVARLAEKRHASA